MISSTTLMLVKTWFETWLIEKNLSQLAKEKHTMEDLKLY